MTSKRAEEGGAAGDHRGRRVTETTRGQWPYRHAATGQMSTLRSNLAASTPRNKFVSHTLDPIWRVPPPLQPHKDGQLTCIGFAAVNNRFEGKFGGTALPLSSKRTVLLPCISIGRSGVDGGDNRTNRAVNYSFVPFRRFGHKRAQICEYSSRGFVILASEVLLINPQTRHCNFKTR